MKKDNFRSITRLLNYFMICLIVFAIAVLLFLPWVANWYISQDYTSYLLSNSLYLYIVGILYASGICAIIILNELRKLFKSCKDDNPFTLKNVKSLRIIALVSFIIGLVFLSKIFILNSFLTMIVVFVFFVASVFSYVLSVLFESAVNFKEENDLTI